ncbi:MULTISPECIES: hypothetical protein [unclassified Psychrobacter]|uniref:hypothetical protein n=1 Tax=unclassified Psychrobacter TaxID=196806 RepID=UPI0018F42180|nr:MULTISPECIES: hypothetical protein [unclassified Psychrobacter]
MRERISPTDVKEAHALNRYVANNFVIAHIENVYANGDEAVALMGFDPDDIDYYPFIVALDREGKYVGNMVSPDAIRGFEIRSSGGEEFRGYDRGILLNQLKNLRQRLLKRLNSRKNKKPPNFLNGITLQLKKLIKIYCFGILNYNLFMIYTSTKGRVH